MKIKVVVESQEKVNEWLKSQQPAFIKREMAPVAPAIMNDTLKTSTDTIQKMVVR
jgi:heme/copper-type cytochrome/quinol oxidase subunit 2